MLNCTITKPHAYLAGLVIVLSIVFATPAQAKLTYDDAKSSLGTVSDLTGVQKIDALSAAGSVAGKAVYLLGVMFLILMVYGGIKWMTARGDEDQATKARETIFGAVIGLSIVLASYAISKFVNDRILNSQTSGPTQANPDTQGGEPLGCCVNWIKINDLGISTNKNYQITTEADCKALGEVPDTNGSPTCTGPAAGCWQFTPGTTDENDCKKLSDAS